MIIASIISVFINSAPNRKILGYSYKEQFMDIFPPLMLSLLMALIIYPVSYVNLPEVLVLIIQIILGIIIYIIGSVVTKQDSFIYLLTLLKK